jgi:hypothetical protein
LRRGPRNTKVFTYRDLGLKFYVDIKLKMSFGAMKNNSQKNLNKSIAWVLGHSNYKFS